MSRRNYKIIADIETTIANRARTLTILDTGEDPNFIRIDTLPQGYETFLKPGPLPNICDANGKRIYMHGVVTLQVELGGYRLALDSIVFHSLATPCILGTDFFDRFVEAIRPKLKSVELENVTTIPIVRNPRTKAPSMHPTQEMKTAPTPTASPHVRSA